MPEEPQRIRFNGRNEDERIFSAQQFAIGKAIIQRFGQQMTEDERNWMMIAMRLYISPEGEQIGGVEPVQPVTQPQPVAHQPHPTQPPQKRK